MNCGWFGGRQNTAFKRITSSDVKTSIKCRYCHCKCVEARAADVFCCPFHWSWAGVWNETSLGPGMEIAAFACLELLFCLSPASPAVLEGQEQSLAMLCCTGGAERGPSVAFPSVRRSAALRSAAIPAQCSSHQPSEIHYSALSGWLQRALLGRRLPKQHLRATAGRWEAARAPRLRSVPFPAAAEGGNVVSGSPRKAELAETAAARCPQLSLASELHVCETGACSRAVFGVRAPSLLHSLCHSERSPCWVRGCASGAARTAWLPRAASEREHRHPSSTRESETQLSKWSFISAKHL